MRKKWNFDSSWLVVACIICHVGTSLLMIAYNASVQSFSYTDRIVWHQLFNGFTRMNFSAARNVLSLGDLLFFTATFLGLALVISTRRQVRSILRFAFFIAQPFLFWSGWVGLILLAAFPFEARKLDGEWFGEHSPTLISLGLWIAVSIVIAIRSLRRPNLSQA